MEFSDCDIVYCGLSGSSVLLVEVDTLECQITINDVEEMALLLGCTLVEGLV